MLGKFKESAAKRYEPQAAQEPTKRTKSLGEGHWVILCDEPNCPLASDMNFGKEQCIFHFAAEFDQKMHVTWWVTKHYRLIQIAKFYDRFGILDGEREVVLEAFNRACVRFGFDPLPPEDHPYFIRPIDYVQALCQQSAQQATAKKKEGPSYDDPIYDNLPPQERGRQRRMQHIGEVLNRLVNRARSVEADATEMRPF